MQILNIVLACCFLHKLRRIEASSSCYDSKGRAVMCAPEFQNVAFNMEIEATNTCGLTEPQEFCLETGVTGSRESCGHICDAQSPRKKHPAIFMTDFNNQNNRTWWQSETVFERRREWWNSNQQPVNLTLSLGKSYEVTYIWLRFVSRIPESFAIFKRTTEDSPWVPYQFYSGSCKNTYNVENKRFTSREKQDEASCSDAHYSLLGDWDVGFSTLGRPDAVNFENSPILQEWVTATDIRIVLTRMHMFSEDDFSDPRVLRSYFYAIEDITVEARCKCNGHARSCSIGLDSRMKCDCEHNTKGPDCGACLDGSELWHRATYSNGFECQNRDVDECSTSHNVCSSRCVNTVGSFLCGGANGYVSQQCKPCNCHAIGSRDNFCDIVTGQCLCIPNVYQRTCSECNPGFYGFPYCKPCECNGNAPTCENLTGRCIDCLNFTTGDSCERCLPGYHGDPRIDYRVPCQPCMCPGGPTHLAQHADSCYFDPRLEYVVCDCYPGFQGPDCGTCTDNYFGMPSEVNGTCEQCDCNNNIDLDAPGNCDHETGECLQCIYNTEGFNCEKCKAGYFGDALTQSCIASDSIPAPTEAVITTHRIEKPAARIAPRYLLVGEGATARFYCSATGSPQPTLRWYRGGNRPVNQEAILTRDGSLIIPRARLEDKGDYYCRATNQAGTSDIRTDLFITRGNCLLPRAIGSCRNVTIRWHYNGWKCERFWYSGCEGNGNNFDTEYQCQQTCSGYVTKETTSSTLLVTSTGMTALVSTSTSFNRIPEFTDNPKIGGEFNHVPVVAVIGTVLALTIVVVAVVLYCRRRNAPAVITAVILYCRRRKAPSVITAVILYCRRRKAPSVITDEMYRGYKNTKRSPIPQPRVDIDSADNLEQQEATGYAYIRSNEIEDGITDMTEDEHYTSPRFSDGAYCSIPDATVSKSDDKDGYLTPTFEDRETFDKHGYMLPKAGQTTILEDGETFDKHGYLLPKTGQTPKYIELQEA